MSPALARKPLAALSAGTFCLALVLAVADAARPSPAQIPEVLTASETATLPVTPQNYPGLFTTWNRVTTWDISGANETVLAAGWGLHKFRDGVPNLIPAPHGNEHVVCMLPKVGSSRWKRLLFMKNSRPQVPNKQIKPHQDQMSWTKDATREAIVARISDPEKLRFMWLRNPYSRLLSGFLDKGVGGNVNENYNIRMDNYGAPFEPTPGEFLRFVKALLSMRADGAHIDEHFSPQAEQCGLQHGMQYDFHLKVEDIHVWYPDLIALFGLEDTVSSGWSFLPDTPDCFYPLPNKTCDLTDLIIAHHSEFLAVTRANRAHKQHDLKQSFLESATSKHSHSADKHIQEFYNTKEVLELATEYLHEDLEQFGYPEMAWNDEQGKVNA